MNPDFPPADRNLNFVARDGDPIHASVVGLLGLIGFVLGLWLVFRFKLSPEFASLTLLTLTACPMACVEFFVNRVHHRDSSGLNSIHGITNHRRILRKYVGLLLTFGALAFLYWLFPEYRKTTYAPVWSLAVYLVPVALLLAIPYFAWVDSRQVQPQDAYFKIGSAAFGENPKWEPHELRDHALSWAVKGFFLPIMLSFLAINLEKLLAVGFGFGNFADFYVSLINLIFTVDVTFGAIGYLLTCRQRGRALILDIWLIAQAKNLWSF